MDYDDYLIIGIMPSKFVNGFWVNSKISHVFILMKKFDKELNEKKYLILQSYFFEYCPKITELMLYEVLDLFDKIQNLFFVYSNSNLVWSSDDNNIWKKYFHVDLSSYIGNTHIDNIPIKFIVDDSINIHNQTLFTIDKGQINKNNCYKYITKLVNKSKEKIYNLFDNICINILNLFDLENENYSRSLIIRSINDDKFISIKENEIYPEDTIKELMSNRKKKKSFEFYEEIPIKWNIMYERLSLTTINSILDDFKINNAMELYNLLKVLNNYFDLENIIMYNNSNLCLINGGGNSSILKYNFNDYLSYKNLYKYLKN